jgi:HAMP domain-containing protein
MRLVVVTSSLLKYEFGIEMIDENIGPDDEWFTSETPWGDRHEYRLKSRTEVFYVRYEDKKHGHLPARKQRAIFLFGGVTVFWSSLPFLLCSSFKKEKIMFRYLVSIWSVLFVFAAVFSCWLWGSSAGQHLSAASDSVRAGMLEYEPLEMRESAIAKKIDVASDEVRKLASLVHSLSAEIADLDDELNQLEDLQANDEKLLAGLRSELEELDGEEHFVTIRKRRFTKEDIATDAETILARHAARSIEIADLRSHREHQSHLREDLNRNLKQRYDRLRAVELGQQRIARLGERRKFASKLSKVDLGGAAEDILGSIEVEQNEIVRELMGDAHADRILSEVREGSATPAANELQKECEPSLSERLDLILKKGADSEGS